jgi:hypothetical protein
MVLPDEDTATFIQQCINNARASLLIRNHDADISKREQDIPDLLDSDADNQDSIKQYHTPTDDRLKDDDKYCQDKQSFNTFMDDLCTNSEADYQTTIDSISTLSASSFISNNSEDNSNKLSLSVLEMDLDSNSTEDDTRSVISGHSDNSTISSMSSIGDTLPRTFLQL